MFALCLALKTRDPRLQPPFEFAPVFTFESAQPATEHVDDSLNPLALHAKQSRPTL
jgi:hypothetical protein